MDTYEKKYKDALERARQFSEHPLQEDSSNIVEYIFPELQESEDEKIRKSLLDYLHTLPNHFSHNGSIVIDWIAWLEKQGKNDILEDAVVDSNDDGLIADALRNKKIEPKFKVGNWITNGDYTWKIIEVKPLDYILQSQDGNIVDDTISHVDGQFHSFTIEDAKDGDVLASNKSVFIFQEEYIAEKPIAYCGIMNGCFIKGEDTCWTNGKCYPAIKEQRNLLFQKIKDAGYKWDEGKKELRKIEKKPQRMISAEAKEALYDKPTDNDMVEALRTEYEKGKADAFAEMQKEWSEEDENHVISLLERLEGLCRNEFERTRFAINEDQDWLNSLKERYFWKPKTWEIQILESVIEKGENPKNYSATLHSILEQLKKLKGE